MKTKFMMICGEDGEETIEKILQEISIEEAEKKECFYLALGNHAKDCYYITWNMSKRDLNGLKYYRINDKNVPPIIRFYK